MFIRYFVNADETPAGQLALAYLPALVRIAPIRLIDPRRLVIGELEGKWARFGALLATPMTGPFVNVVATSPDRWTWVQKLTAPLKDDPNDPKVPTEQLEGRLELYTRGVRNVLITLPPAPFEHVGEWLHQSQAAAKYEAIIVPRPTSAFAAPTWHIPVPVTDHGKLRHHILGV